MTCHPGRSERAQNDMSSRAKRRICFSSHKDAARYTSRFFAQSPIQPRAFWMFSTELAKENLR